VTAAPRGPWIVVGAGYTGARVARALAARGDDVVITRRRSDDAAALAAGLGVAHAALDLAEPPTIAAALARAATVVVTAPPIDLRGGGEAALARAAADAGIRRVVYLSSTGVYAPAAGAWVDEDFPCAPITGAGRARLAAEQALAAGAVACVRLRVAGIHGPGRGVIARMRTGTYRLVGDGDTCVSRVHVDDLVACAIAAGDADAPGPIYNVADDLPCTSRELACAVAEALGLPMPPAIPLAAVDAETAGMLTADRRIANARVKRELGVALRYPSWRDVLAAELGHGHGHGHPAA
jgi:nucleoside-diphosphate-sugar epimerase